NPLSRETGTARAIYPVPDQVFVRGGAPSRSPLVSRPRLPEDSPSLASSAGGPIRALGFRPMGRRAFALWLPRPGAESTFRGWERKGLRQAARKAGVGAEGADVRSTTARRSAGAPRRSGGISTEDERPEARA